MFPTQNFERLVTNALSIILGTYVTPGNLKIGLEVSKASGKLTIKFRAGVTVK